MFNLRRANPERERAEATVARGMAIAADYCCAGQRKALLWPDDMDDALFSVRRINIADAKRGRIGFKCGELRCAFDVRNRDALSSSIKPRGRGEVMIGNRQRKIRPPHFAPSEPERLKRLRTGHLMNKVAINVDQAGAIRASRDDMRGPDFLIKCAGFTSHGLALTPRAPQSSRSAINKFKERPEAPLKTNPTFQAEMLKRLTHLPA